MNLQINLIEANNYEGKRLETLRPIQVQSPITITFIYHLNQIKTYII